MASYLIPPQLASVSSGGKGVTKAAGWTAGEAAAPTPTPPADEPIDRQPLPCTPHTTL